MFLRKKCAAPSVVTQKTQILIVSAIPRIVFVVMIGVIAMPSIVVAVIIAAATAATATAATTTTTTVIAAATRAWFEAGWKLHLYRHDDSDLI
ncbi:MAG TPA: hypothetical protein VEC93_03125, partial [Anaerolineae bacterium]|nr:hypothetical protein [Anaerolineae bacterium]